MCIRDRSFPVAPVCGTYRPPVPQVSQASLIRGGIATERYNAVYNHSRGIGIIFHHNMVVLIALDSSRIRPGCGVVLDFLVIGIEIPLKLAGTGNIQSDVYKRQELYCADYSKIFSMAEQEDFMFLDPPYDCVFHDYGNRDKLENGFDEAEHRRLAADFRNLSCRALMVIGKTPLTEELYGDYIVDEYYKNYSVNIRNRFHNDSMHLIIKNLSLIHI